MTRINRLVTVGVGLVVMGIVASVVPVNAQSKEARGTITAITDRTVTVKTGTQEMTFSVDGQTHLSVRTAAKQVQQAQPGSPSPRVNDFFETGQAVLVRYREEGGRNRALDIERVGSPGAGPDATKIAEGRVKSVTPAQLTIESGGKELAFAVTGDTDVQAKGASATTKAAAGKPTIATYIHVGDMVSVSYRDAGGKMTASEVRLRVASK